jgi:succinoglycan biosynthesis transport protein ExoP
MAENPQKNYGSSASGHYGRDEPAVERRSIRDYYIILRERLWIALPLALLLSVGLGYFQARETPMFSATATMQFEKGERIVEAQQVVDPTVTSEIDLNTNLRLLESTRLKSRVANSFTPEEVKSPPGSVPQGSQDRRHPSGGGRLPRNSGRPVDSQQLL